jgi:SAM-dependent methyltransferase
VPNPFPCEHGLKTSRGIISYRVPQSIYQASRIKQLVQGISNPRVLEIGAGLGRTAYYAYEMGIKDYTIIDIPITAAAQAYFLGRTIGDKNIYLDGERSNESSLTVKILTPQTFFNETKTYDLIVNVDSLTEMDFSVAQAYWNKIKVTTSTFLSINHEANAFRVRDLIVDDLSMLNIRRELYWMRRGYTEELIQLPGSRLAVG